MTNRISRRNMEGYFTAFREMRFWKRSHPGDKRLVGLWFSYIVDPVIWKALRCRCVTNGGSSGPGFPISVT